MKEYVSIIQVDSEELERVFDDLHKAEETIKDCYNKLRDMGIVRIEEKGSADSGN